MMMIPPKQFLVQLLLQSHQFHLKSMLKPKTFYSLTLFKKYNLNQAQSLFPVTHGHKKQSIFTVHLLWNIWFLSKLKITHISCNETNSLNPMMHQMIQSQTMTNNLLQSLIQAKLLKQCQPLQPQLSMHHYHIINNFLDLLLQFWLLLQQYYEFGNNWELWVHKQFRKVQKSSVHSTCVVWFDTVKQSNQILVQNKMEHLFKDANFFLLYIFSALCIKDLSRSVFILKLICYHLIIPCKYSNGVFIQCA